MKETFKTMADRMAKKIRVMYLSVDHYENKRNCPFFSELKGMEQALVTMGIEYEYEYDSDYKIAAVIVMGEKVEI